MLIKKKHRLAGGENSKSGYENVILGYFKLTFSFDSFREGFTHIFVQHTYKRYFLYSGKREFRLPSVLFRYCKCDSNQPVLFLNLKKCHSKSDAFQVRIKCCSSSTIVCWLVGTMVRFHAISHAQFSRRTIAILTNHYVYLRYLGLQFVRTGSTSTG